jgi:hypothetical protein
MSQPHAIEAPMAGEPHAVADDSSAHGRDDQGHDQSVLGPIDWVAWGAGLVGVALGLAVAWAFMLANLLASTR